MTNPDTSKPGDSAASELGRLLERAGITLPPERIAEVTEEYEAFRKQIALVNDAVTAQDEPAVMFVARARERSE
jgi:hypothetical protein